MKKIITFILLLLIILTIVFFISSPTFKRLSSQAPIVTSTPTGSSESAERLSVLAENLDTPWAIALLPEGGMLVTERKGTIRLISKENQLKDEPVATLSTVKEAGEGGLLGIALHPDFSMNKYVYLYYTYSQNGENTLNRVVRMTYDNDTFGKEEIVVNAIPGASNHNGGRIKFGPDGYLYIGTGDAQEPSSAQSKTTLAGKILRVTDRGLRVAENPFNNQVYSYGHRNVQGLAWSSDGSLWATEHGRSGVRSGLDELNLIEMGLNYGWPEIEGDEKLAGMMTAIFDSGSTTWAPSGAAFVENSLFFAGLRGSTLYEAVIEDGKVIEVKEHLSGELGRIREVVADESGLLYITTSNTDGRGIPDNTDDKVIKINPQKL